MGATLVTIRTPNRQAVHAGPRRPHRARPRSRRNRRGRHSRLAPARRVGAGARRHRGRDGSRELQRHHPRRSPRGRADSCSPRLGGQDRRHAHRDRDEPRPDRTATHNQTTLDTPKAGRSSIDAVADAVVEDLSVQVLGVAADEPGTLTVVFGDIESSTALAVALGDSAWLDLLRRHDALVHAHVDAHGGRVVKHQGDGYMLCFRSAHSAIFCAIGIQRDLARREWRADHEFRERMGMHTGEVVMDDAETSSASTWSSPPASRHSGRWRDPRLVPRAPDRRATRRRHVRGPARCGAPRHRAASRQCGP